jgi:sigma-E factor negative regulatory protein RseA
MTEHISALADDEIDFNDAELQPNSHMAEVWSHYHLIGDVMRGANALSPNFKQNLMQRIELEPTVLSPNAGLKKQSPALSQSVEVKSKLPVTWSIAASFAAVMVVGWMVLQTQVINHVAPQMVAQVVPSEAITSQALPITIAAPAEQVIPAEYLMAHQATVPSASSYYIQSASYTE